MTRKNTLIATISLMAMTAACGMDDGTATWQSELSWSPTPGMTMQFETEVSWPDERWTVVECGPYAGREACRVVVEMIYESLGVEPYIDAWITKWDDGEWRQFDEKFGNGWDRLSGWPITVSNPFATVPVDYLDEVEPLETVAGTFFGCLRKESDWEFNQADDSWERTADIHCPGVGWISREVEDTNPAYSVASLKLVTYLP